MADNKPNSPVQDPKQSDTDSSSAQEAGSLEQPATAVAPSAPKEKKLSTKDRFKKLTSGTNLYLLGFIFVVLFAVAVIYIALSRGESGTKITIDDDDQISQIIDDLAENEANIGDVTQTLTVEANTIFNGRILVKDNLDVAGSINVGGPLTLPGITVSGSSTFDDVEIGNNLSILGNTSVQGTLSVQNSLSVSGNGSFTGNVSAETITANQLEIAGDLLITRHIDTGGASPSISSGSAIGSGGTVSLSGTDTAGTVTINTGGGPSTGVLATITFNKTFNSTPHVLVSAVSSDAAALEVYVVRSSTGFTVRTTSTPDASTTYIFDFIALE